MSRTAQKAGEAQHHKQGSFRYAEKRRTGTCQFADRIAQAALDKYRRVVPQWHRDHQKHECVAAVLAHFPPPPPDPTCTSTANDTNSSTGTLHVIGLGVGTKFLPDSIIREEERLSTQYAKQCAEKGANIDANDESDSIDIEPAIRYGARVRDCHAEVLARRAFRWQIMHEIHADLRRRRECGYNENEPREQNEEANTSKQPYMSILERLSDNACTDGPAMYGLMHGVTLHFYSSSAPCGNATLKKFAKMTREKYDDTLGPDEWPERPHEVINGHAIREGQFALLIKKDNSIITAEKEDCKPPSEKKPKGKRWPANESDYWCPPGTTICGMKRGSMHTCSDKLARWNCLGLQGSLLLSLVESPLHATTLTIGRKMTECICRRAVCCRAWGYAGSTKRTKGGKSDESKDAATNLPDQDSYKLNHPTLMGTAVYIDEDGVLDMSGEKLVGQDFRFGSDLCWVYASGWTEAECINGSTGFRCEYAEDKGGLLQPKEDQAGSMPSRVSTAALVDLYVATIELMRGNIDGIADGVVQQVKGNALTLKMLRDLKRNVSPRYESSKERLLKDHRVFRQWVRRER